MSALPLPDDDDELGRLLGAARPRDLLADAINRARPLLTHGRPTKARIRILWSAAKKARELGASDVVHDAFMALAVDVNLIDKHGHWTGTDVRQSVRRFGAQDISHVISLALRGWNPFEKGSLT